MYRLLIHFIMCMSIFFIGACSLIYTPTHELDKIKEKDIISFLDSLNSNTALEVNYPDSLIKRKKLDKFIVGDHMLEFRYDSSVVFYNNHFIYFYTSPDNGLYNIFSYWIYHNIFPMFYDIIIYDINKGRVIYHYHIKGELRSIHIKDNYIYVKNKNGYYKLKLEIYNENYPVDRIKVKNYYYT